MYDLDVICNTYSIEFPIFFMKKGFFVRWSFYWVKESSMLGETKKRGGSLGKFRHVRDTIYGNFYTIQYKFYPLLKNFSIKYSKKKAS